MSAVAKTMNYRYLGNTGLLVSTFSLGCMCFDANVDAAYEIMVKAYQTGVNFFDNAEGYSRGLAEKTMGQAIQRGIDEGVWTREELVISTKIFFGTKYPVVPNSQRLSRKHIIEGTKASLKRIGSDYVDLVLCHRPDNKTPIEETVRAMNYVIEQGWAYYWGTSEWSSHDIMEACEVADRLGLIRPTFEQPEYNLLNRSRVEYDFIDLYKKYKFGLTTFSPLMNGILAGRYNNGIPEDSRFGKIPVLKGLVGDLDARVQSARELEPIAKEMGATLAQFSNAWCAVNKNVSTVMLGASSVHQLEENLKAFAFVDKFTPEILARVDEIVQYRPNIDSTAKVDFAMRLCPDFTA